MIIDTSYLTYKLAYNPMRYEYIERLADRNSVFCFDDTFSYRKEKYTWYKSNRETLLKYPGQEELKSRAKELQKYIITTYPSLVYEQYGLEADDIIAQEVKYALDTGNTPVVLGEDHDFLQFPSTRFVTHDMLPWDIQRIKSKLPLKQGSVYLAYQIMVGCTTDTVPRTLFSKDRSTAKWVMQSDNPLQTVIDLLPEQLLEQSLEVLMMPTCLGSKKSAMDNLRFWGDLKW